MTKFSAPQQNQLAQIGAFLRENREKQEKSLEDIAIRTYIRPQLLNGIETGNPDTLPEPIFVQGFIRRYGEALGLNGIELSQQFSVASIPSTPRPAPPAPLSDTPTTRLTRASTAQPSIPVAPMPVVSNEPLSIPTVNTNQSGAEALTLGRMDNDPVANGVAPGVADSATAEESFERQLNEITQPEAQTSVGATGFREESDVDTDIPVLGASNEVNSAADTNAADTDELSYAASDSTALESDIDPDEEDFSSMVAAFDKENLSQQGDPALTLGQSDLEMSAPEMSAPEMSAPTDTTTVTNELGNTSFDDDLPAAFTTEAAVPATGSAELSASAARPVETGYLDPSVSSGYEENQTNLKPFVLGGVLAAIALLGVLIASVVGGGRQPSVADDPATIEQAEEAALPPIPDEAEPEVVETPAISEAPVYVEGTAVREAWVSVIADGETVFEEILQPGDSQVWEAQESLSIYSGDAGALELAANGEDAEVMGEAGQPDEKIFP